jgi:hypothetical protein
MSAAQGAAAAITTLRTPGAKALAALFAELSAGLQKGMT